MLKTFLLLTIRNLRKNLFFVMVNVLGLGVTLACCIVAYFNYRFEADFNKNHHHLDKIYKVNIFREINGHEQRYGISPISLAPAINVQVAGAESAIRYTTNGMPIRHGNNADSKIFNQRVAFADSQFFNLFTFPVRWGSTASFPDLNSIILSLEASSRFFGDSNPLGQSVTLTNALGQPIEFKVTAVLEHIPENSMVNFDAITIFNNYLSLTGTPEMDWKTWVGTTFLSIPNQADVLKVERFINSFTEVQNKAREDWQVTRFEVMSLRDYTQISRDVWSNWLGVNLHPAQIVGPFIMAILILLLASFNYMNTSISIANTRLKEIGVRKVMGSSRGQLIAQFLGENALVCLLALGVSLGVSVFLLNEYNKMWSYMNLTMNLSNNIGFWFFLAFLLVFTSILAGAYSAFYISSFKPVEVFRRAYKLKEGGWLSRVLLWFQLTVSVIALVVSIVFTQNASFQESIDMGYDMDRMLAVPLTTGVDARALKSAFESHPDVESVCYTSNHIGWGGYTRTLEQMDRKTEVRVLEVGASYLESMGVRLLEGRGLNTDFETSDIAQSAVIDMRAAEELGLTDPVGKTVRLDTLTLKIVGVTDNFHMSFWSKPTPMVFWRRTNEPLSLLVVRTKPNTRKGVLDFLESQWVEQVPFAPFSGFEQVDVEAEAHDVNKNITNINLFLAVIAVALSVIALYTLVTLNILKRVKEIGVRTVLGSSHLSINWLISRPFMLIALLASVSGSAGGYYLSHMLLSSLWPVRVPISTASIAVPVVFVAALAYLIISLKVFLTLSRNPSESLRYE